MRSQDLEIQPYGPEDLAMFEAFEEAMDDQIGVVAELLTKRKLDLEFVRYPKSIYQANGDRLPRDARIGLILAQRDIEVDGGFMNLDTVDSRRLEVNIPALAAEGAINITFDHTYFSGVAHPNQLRIHFPGDDTHWEKATILQSIAEDNVMNPLNEEQQDILGRATEHLTTERQVVEYLAENPSDFVLMGTGFDDDRGNILAREAFRQ